MYAKHDVVFCGGFFFVVVGWMPSGGLHRAQLLINRTDNVGSERLFVWFQLQFLFKDRFYILC